MECINVRDTLSDYVDGGLPATQAHQVAHHMTECDGCQRLELQLSEIRSAARDLPLHTPSKALWTRISNMIEAEGLIADPRATMSMKKETLLDRWRAAWAALSMPQLAGAGALAALLVTFGGIGFYRQFSNVVTMGGLQAALLPEESQLKSEFDLRFNALKAKLTGLDAQRRSALDAEMNRLEKSIEMCRLQLQAQPQDAQQLEQMRRLYAEKSALLDKIEQAK